MKLIQRIRKAVTATGTISFCDSCSQVCDPACRGTALRDNTLTTALLMGRR